MHSKKAVDNYKLIMVTIIKNVVKSFIKTLILYCYIKCG